MITAATVKELRDKTNDFFVKLSEAKVPVLLLSAGVGELVSSYRAF